MTDRARSTLRPRATSLGMAAAIVALGFLGSRLLGVLRTVAIADAFGSSPDLAAYNVAFRVPDLIFQLLAGATLASAFIPVFARTARQQPEEEAWALASRVLNIITVATAALCAVAFVLAPLLVPLVAPGLGEGTGRQDELTDKAVDLTRIMLLSPLLFAVSGIVTGILNGRQRFFLSALSPMLYNLAIIFGAVVLAEPWGIEGLAVSVIAGAGLHLVVQVPGLVQERMRWRPALGWSDPGVREVARLMGPRVAGLAAAQVNYAVTTTFFASKISDSAINYLTYAFLIAALPLGVFGMALSTASFPRLAEHVAQRDFDALRQTLSRVLRVIMFLTIPAACGLALLRNEATTVLLQRGEFNAADAAATAAVLGYYSLAIVPQAGIEIHSRGFYALGDTRTPVLFAVLAVALNVALSAIFYGPLDLEAEGLALALAISAWAEWVLLYAAYVRRAGDDPAADLAAIARYALAAAVMMLALAAALPLAEADTGAGKAVVALAGGLSGAAIYAGLATWFGFDPGLRERLAGRFMRR